jgi:hypothetical protein
MLKPYTIIPKIANPSFCKVNGSFTLEQLPVPSLRLKSFGMSQFSRYAATFQRNLLLPSFGKKSKPRGDKIIQILGVAVVNRNKWACKGQIQRRNYEV